MHARWRNQALAGTAALRADRSLYFTVAALTGPELRCRVEVRLGAGGFGSGTARCGTESSIPVEAYHDARTETLVLHLGEPPFRG